MADIERFFATTLNYARPARDQKRPSFWLAGLLCAPGAVCWLALLTPFVLRWLPYFWQSRLMSVPLRFQIVGVLCCWAAAVVTAITSLVLYTGRRKPWYVVINLIINVTGLSLTTLAVVLVALARMH